MKKYNRLYKLEKMEDERKELRFAVIGANSSPEAMQQLVNIINGKPVERVCRFKTVNDLKLWVNI